MSQPVFKSDPEAYLNLFNRRLFKFYKSILLFNDKNIEDKTRDLFKKTLMSEVLNKNQFISISGMQGVGKSTILAQLYDLPDNLIPQNLERGERLPILFTERNNDSQAIKTFAWKINKNDDGHTIEKEEIKESDFQQRCLAPSGDDIFLEIEVPRKVFEIEGISFLLLPGLEDSNENWQNLVELSLKLSSNTVFVFNETKFADLRNRKSLDYIRKEFEDAKPVFCLSFADQSKDSNESLRKSVIDKYKIDNNEFDRVVITGTNPEELKAKWKTSFREAINKYTRTEKGFRKKQVELLNNLMSNDAVDILRDFERLIPRKQIELKMQDNEYQSLMAAFDDKVEKLREKYLKTVSEFLEEFSKKPSSELDSKLADTGFFKRLKNRLIGKSHAEQLEFETRINDSWDNANGFKIHEVFPNVLTRVISRELYAMGYNINLMLPPENLEESLVKYDEEKVSEKLLPGNVLKNIEIISNDKHLEVLLEPSPKAAIELIPVLALESLRIFATLGQSINDREINDPKIFLARISEIADEFVFLKDTHSKVLLAAAGIFGIDISDGTVDSIPLILKHLGIELGATATALLNVSIAAGVVGILATVLFRQVNKQSLEERQYLKRLIELLMDGYKQKYIEIFEDLMDSLRSRLDNKLSKLYLTDINHHRFENAKRFYKLVGDAQLKIREEITPIDLL